MTAKVQGNYGVYDVLVQFQVFQEKQKQAVYSIVEKNPILFAHILNGELPDELLNALNKVVREFCRCMDYLGIKCILLSKSPEQ